MKSKLLTLGALLVALVLFAEFSLTKSVEAQDSADPIAAVKAFIDAQTEAGPTPVLAAGRSE